MNYNIKHNIKGRFCSIFKFTQPDLEYINYITTHTKNHLIYRQVFSAIKYFFQAFY